jgi:LEA14-like dessication related protein
MKLLFTKALSKLRNLEYGSLLLCSLWLGLAAGCTTLHPGFETPSVNVTSFKPLPSQSFTPRFEIGMRVVNPNSTSLNLRGMSYKVFLNDYEVVEGAANELPVVPAYGEAQFNVIATVSLMEGMRFVQDMLKNANGQVDYRLQVKLDVGAMIPVIRIEKTGSYAP